ncbi:MAG: CHAT domain-containing protein [Gemmatimonadota bacterium]
MALWRERREQHNEVVLVFMNDLGQAHYRAGNIGAAAALIEEVITRRQQLSADDTPALALALLNLGSVRQEEGDFVAAESHMLAALAMRRRLFPPADPTIRESLRLLAELYAAQDDHRRATPYFEELLTVARHRDDPMQLSRALNGLATAYYKAGDIERSVPLYENALAIAIRTVGEAHPNTAVTMGNLANALRQVGAYDRAEHLLREVIAARRTALGELHSHVAVAIDDLTDLFRDKRSGDDLQRSYTEVVGMVLRYVNDPSASIARLLQSLRKIDRTHASLAMDRRSSLARSEVERLRNNGSLDLRLIARLTFHLGEYSYAATLFAEVCGREPRGTLEWSQAMTWLAGAVAQGADLVEAERVCDDYIALVHAGWEPPADHFAALLRTKSQVQELAAGARAAVETMREAVAQSARARSKGLSDSLAENQLRLSELLLSAGDRDEAAEISLDLLNEQPSVGVQTVARAQAVLGHVRWNSGHLVEAESLFRAALPPLLAVEPTARTARLLRDFGVFYASQSNAEKATALIRRAVDMAEALLGKRSLLYADVLETLAEITGAFGPVHEAPPMFVEVAGIAEETGTPQLLARALRGTGDIYVRLGASEGARLVLTQALAATARFDATALEIAIVEIDLARVEGRTKKYDVAIELIDRAIARLLGVNGSHALLLKATIAKAWILGGSQRWEEAALAAREVSIILDERFAQPFTITSTSAQDRIADALYQHLDVVVSIAIRLRSPAAIRDACEWTLRWKGATLAWNATRVRALAHSVTVELKALRRDYIDVQRAIVRQSISGPPAPQDSATAMEELRRRAEALDHEIGRHLASESNGEAARATRVSLETVREKLPIGTALVEYLRYEVIDFHRGAPGDRFHRGTLRYAAFIVRPDCEPAIIDIGDADAVDLAISRFRSAITCEADPGGIPAEGPWVDDSVAPKPTPAPMGLDAEDWVAAGNALRQMVFDPFREGIGSCTRLCIAQHGELTRLPFAALPIDDGYLIDRYELILLDTGRDLLKEAGPTIVGDAPLVMADPDFDLELEGVPKGERRRPFTPLSGTREEGVAVAAILGVAPVMGGDAVEARLRSALPPRILHLASHGFFLTDERPPKSANFVDTLTVIEIPGFGNYAAEALDKPRESDVGVDPITRLGQLQDPLLRSGIALAGVNSWASGHSLSSGDDGLLTAAEIALLDFTATDLVVLSACETGLGEVRRGEGIFGLRRAFAIAGASALVMSVWKVPDEQTRDLMIEFYRRVSAGEACAQALSSAQRYVRAITPHPQAWAGFLCIGTTPLDVS